MCLNCGAALTGPFCAQCGQRVVPAYPTIREFAGDAWDELAGIDGRFARTVRTLFLHPGRLTIDTLQGHRTFYIKPLRLYLWASVLYFVVAAAAPNVVTSTRASVPGEQSVTINLADPRGVGGLTTEERAQLLRNFERAPAPLRALFSAIIEDPVGFRSRVLSAIPRAVFALVAAFAVIAGVFYRRRRFLQHLTFALHIHAMVFIALTIIELAQFTRIVPFIAGVASIVLLYLGWYLIKAQRVVYDSGAVETVFKSVGIACTYVLLWVPVMAAVIAWAVMSR